MAKAKRAVKPAAKTKKAAKPAVKKSTAKKSNVVSLKSAKAKKPELTLVTKIAAIADKQTKAEILTSLSERTGLDKKQVRSVLEAVKALIECHLMPRGSGEFTIPCVGVKATRIDKPATKARKGINPFTGEEIMIAAKPRRKAVRVRAMKELKALLD